VGIVLSKIEQGKIDILMITHNRPEYTRKSLGRLLATCDNSMRVWLWHNGNHEETLNVVKEFSGHPRVCKLKISNENKKLTEPTNWLWANAEGEFVSKVDDDCILPFDWAQTLRSAHNDVPEFGAIGCCRILDEDFDYQLAKKKIFEFKGGHKLLRNCWVQGSGYLLKRQLVEDFGLLNSGQSFTDYCIKLSLQGYLNGFHFPLLYEAHLDDPRVGGTILKDDESFLQNRPLTAIKNNIYTINDWVNWLKNDDKNLQVCSVDPKDYGWLRSKIRRFKRRFKLIEL